MRWTTKQLDGLSTGFGGNDDYPPPPSTTNIPNDNNNSILIFKTQETGTTSQLLQCLYNLNLSFPSSFQPLSYLRSPSIAIAMAYLHSGASSISLLFGFLVVWQARLSIFAVADELEVGGNDLCGTDLSTFLPPPYSNMSNIICSPVWNTFTLRVSLMIPCHQLKLYPQKFLIG